MAGPNARLSPATEAATSRSRKRRAAQVFRAARRAFDGGVLPKAAAARLTPRTGRLHRQRKTSRLDRRMIFVPGRAAALSFPRTTQGGGIPERPSGRFFHPIQTTWRRGFPGAGPASFFPRGTSSGFSRRRHPNFRDDATAPGSSNRGAARFFPIPDGRRPGSFPSAAVSIPSAGRRISAGVPSQRVRLLSFRA